MVVWYLYYLFDPAMTLTFELGDREKATIVKIFKRISPFLNVIKIQQTLIMRVPPASRRPDLHRGDA